MVKLKKKRNSVSVDLFELYNTECGGNTGCSMSNTVAACSGNNSSGGGFVSVIKKVFCKG